MWQRAPSNLSLKDRYIRAVDLLTVLYTPPYPPHALDAFVTQSNSFAAERCIEILRANRPNSGFDDAQRKLIERIAAGHHNEQQREALFQLVAPQLDANSVAAELEVFENDRSSSERIAAGFALWNHYQASAIPIEVVEVADRVIAASNDQKLQRVAAMLIARGDEEFSKREQRLLAALRTHGSSTNLHDAFVELYGDGHSERLVIRYAADTTVPAWFRAGFIRALGQSAKPGATLADETHAALVKAARTSSDYYLISAIKSALIAWHIDIPIIVFLKNKQTHSGALFVLLVLCALANLIIGLIVLFRLIIVPLNSRARIAKRASMTLGWTGFSVVILVLLGFALVGFIGHNSAPNPRDTLKFQIPFYVGTFAYVTIAWFVLTATRHSREESQP